jgi:hypothetical protein
MPQTGCTLAELSGRGARTLGNILIRTPDRSGKRCIPVSARICRRLRFLCFIFDKQIVSRKPSDDRDDECCKRELNNFVDLSVVTTASQ